jgi:hypothetical protein
MHVGGSGKVLAQPLGARLANVQRGADSAHRGNVIGCQFSREHYYGLLPERIDHGRTNMRARRARRRLRATNDDHQEFV